MQNKSGKGQRAKRYLIVSQFFWPENFRVNDLAQELTRRGHSVTVLTGEPNYPEGRIYPAYRTDPLTFLQWGAVSVVRVPVIPRGQSKFQLVLNYISFALSATLLGAWNLRGKSFDSIFVFQTSPVTAALPAIFLRRLKRAPVMMWILDLWPDTLSAIGIVRSPRLLAVVGMLVKFIYRRCDRILVQSRAFAPKVAAMAGSSDKIRYFPGWSEAIFSDPEQPQELVPELLPYEDDFKVLFAGNIGEAQDFPAIIDAADALRSVPHLRWIVVGDGRAAPQVRAAIAERDLADKVIFLGRFPLERMPAFFAAADALLVTLRKDPVWGMTIPGKVQSYLASGTPILAMLDGEGARIVEEAQAGLAAGAGDSAALATNVRRLMDISPEQRAAMGRAGRAYCAREFGMERLFDQLESWSGEWGDQRSLGQGPTARPADGAG
jgi:colanic acid biosynthesis glycosyl transferase WcaI